MKTLGEVLKLTTDFLQERRLAEEAIAYALGCKRLDLYMQFDKPLQEIELAHIRDIVKRCKKHEPIEYIAGEVDFFGCKLSVDSRVLIPRPETEIMTALIAKKVKQGKLWDLCTGSGCIGIALKKANPALDVTLSDISADALIVASSNAQRNGVAVRCLQGDLLAPFGNEKADCIVCNPPYISEAEWTTLSLSVKDFEPKRALLGGVDGLLFYKRLAAVLPQYLNPGAQVFFEIGASQGEAVKQLFPGAILYNDWSGHARIIEWIKKSGS